MSEILEINNIEENSALYELLKNCVNFQSYESLPLEDFNDVCAAVDFSSTIYLDNYPKMITTGNAYSVSGNLSNGSSYTSDDSLGDNILEENGRISLAYENLRTIPRRIAEKFALQTKFLDLSYNNFQNLSFLTFFEDLHTLILDRNSNLEVNSLPYLPNLKILWINNCDIKNIADWIQRIHSQCPSLEYLSIMGNPGIKEFSGCTLNNMYTMDSLIMPPGLITDYREYILQMLPNLQYLDGIPRGSSKHGILNNNNNNIPSSPVSSGNGSSSQSHSNRKISPTLSFKDLFRLNLRKKSYPSSSTN